MSNHVGFAIQHGSRSPGGGSAGRRAGRRARVLPAGHASAGWGHGQGGRSGREDTLARAEEEDNFISVWGGESHRERFGKEGTRTVWFCQR